MRYYRYLRNNVFLANPHLYGFGSEGMAAYDWPEGPGPGRANFAIPVGTARIYWTENRAERNLIAANAIIAAAQKCRHALTPHRNCAQTVFEPIFILQFFGSNFVLLNPAWAATLQQLQLWILNFQSIKVKWSSIRHCQHVTHTHTHKSPVDRVEFFVCVF